MKVLRTNETHMPAHQTLAKQPVPLLWNELAEAKWGGVIFQGIKGYEHLTGMELEILLCLRKDAQITRNNRCGSKTLTKYPFSFIKLKKIKMPDNPKS